MNERTPTPRFSVGIRKVDFDEMRYSYTVYLDLEVNRGDVKQLFPIAVVVDHEALRWEIGKVPVVNVVPRL